MFEILQDQIGLWSVMSNHPDPRVVAIRQDKRVGKGSCTSIDECWGDKELIEMLDEMDIKSPEEAVKWALKSEGLFIDKMLDCRFGDDDDRELLIAKEWEKLNENKSL